MASLENNENLVKLTTETYNILNNVSYDATSASKTETNNEWVKFLPLNNNLQLVLEKHFCKLEFYYSDELIAFQLSHHMTSKIR